MAIELNNLSVTIGKQSILSRLCLSVKSGERLVVLGRSGSGKTTLLRCIAGISKHTQSGAIKLGSQNIALLFQHLALWPHLTVWEHLTLISTQTDRIEALLARFELQKQRRQLPHMLSAGEKQRLALMRCLVNQPDILLLDEPFSSLDLGLKQSLIDFVLELHNQLGFTLLHVTHDPFEACQIGTRFAVLENGAFSSTGTSLPEAIHRQMDRWQSMQFPLDQASEIRQKPTCSRHTCGGGGTVDTLL